MERDVDPPASRGGENLAKRRSRLFDVLMWFACSSGVFLLVVPVGYVSGDTVPLAERLVNGSWLWNPNRLLMEPTASVWLQLLSPLRIDLSVPDQLSLLSMMSGAVSIAVVRGWIVPWIAVRRWVANFATAWFALGSAWLIVLLYGYPVMLQMPFLVIMAALLLRSSDGPALTPLAFAGAAGGMAALSWISNSLTVASLGVAIGLLAWKRHGFRVALSRVVVFGGSAMLALFVPLFLVWSQVVDTELGFLSWLRSYGGGVDGEIAEGYGVEFGLVAMGIAFARAVYGAAMAVVDLSPLVAWHRGSEIDGFRIGARVVAFAAGGVALFGNFVRVVRSPSTRSPQRNDVLVVVAAWVLSVLLFGFLWNNSDDKFYFQLAIPLAMVVGTMDWWWNRKWWPFLVVATLPLLYNAFDVTDRYVLFEREEKVAALTHAYRDAGLVIMPGYEDVAKLSYFVPARGEQRRSVTWLADRYPPDEGIAELRRMLSEAKESCEGIVIVDIMSRNAVGNPWTFLGVEKGYGLKNLQQVITSELPGLAIYERAGFTFATWPGSVLESSCATGRADGYP